MTIGEKLHDTAAITDILDRHIAAATACKTHLPMVMRVVNEIIHCLGIGHRLLLAGNGGSAADAQHIAAELVGQFSFRYGNTRRALAAISLTTDTSVLTAIGNDSGYREVFARQVYAYGCPGDVLLVMSTSGNSPNILRAVEVAKRLDITTIAMTGRAGGIVAPSVDLWLPVPADETARVQECHLLYGHMICDIVDTAFAAAPCAPSAVAV